MQGTAILDCRVIDFPDVKEQVTGPMAPGARNFLASGYRAITIMPLIRGKTAIGAISVVRVAPGPLSEKQRELLKTFAAQAVIAIENTRLLNELRESLQQQTATADVLKVISSSPGELDPVFEAMLEKAVRICDAKFGTVRCAAKIRRVLAERTTTARSGNGSQPRCRNQADDSYRRRQTGTGLHQGGTRFSRCRQSRRISDSYCRSDAQRQRAGWRDRNLPPGGAPLHR
jgi:hypothetical protein